jgi:hypothetical protein
MWTRFSRTGTTWAQHRKIRPVIIDLLHDITKHMTAFWEGPKV